MAKAAPQPAGEPSGNRAGAAAAGAPAAAAASQVPIKQVVLFSSGVGYFEHFGTVKGEGTTELRFKTQQVNDILKSLVLQDLDKGRVTAVTYPSQDPIAKTLKSFQIDLTSNPTLHDILEQLRGTSVTVAVGPEKFTGTVLGVEMKQRPLGDKDDKKVVEVWYVNLLIGAGIRQVPLEEVRDVQLEDAKLREELGKALAALAQSRDQDKKPVTIRFSGQGDRRVRIGYVVEAPVWKTSYRLLIDGPSVAGDKGAAGEKDTEDKSSKKPGEAAAVPDNKPGAGGAIQGWAIIENQTESDWTDVQLSLVSGRPISFIQDLYRPLYVPRPVVQPELYASLRPQTYEGGLALKDKAAEWGARREKLDEAEADRLVDGTSMQLRQAARKSAPAQNRGLAAGAGAPMGGAMAGEDKNAEYAKLGLIDAASSVASAASASKLGELFQYTVGSVSLPRQKSAMIPIVADAVEVEKVSIYNAAVLAKHPLYGARLKNTTGKHLLQGPITVLQGGSYAGDAKIEDLPPGQERLISYGIDLQVLVQTENVKQDNVIQTGSIVKGVLHLKRKVTAGQDYVAEDKGTEAKTLIVEHPRRGGDWKLVEPAKAQETTDALYRFKDKIEPGKPKRLTVREEIVTGETLAILPMDPGQLDVYARTGEIPKDVRDALAKAAQLKGAMADTQRKMQENQKKSQQITQEQQRMRENMKTVAQNTEYYTRLLKKLDEQETQIETLQKDHQSLQLQLDKQRKELEDYLGGLKVG